MTAEMALQWLHRLEPKLEARKLRIAEFNRYYDGEHPMAYASEKFRTLFGGEHFDGFSDNWCGVVADAPEERLSVTGFRFGDDPKADDDANRIWQSNQMDAQSQLAHVEAIVSEEAAVTVWADRDGQPDMAIESPEQMIVQTDSNRTRKRVAAVKIWVDEWTGTRHATVYLEDGIYKFQKVEQRQSSGLQVIRAFSSGPKEEWVPREVAGEVWPVKNPLGVVPVVPLPNRPRLLKPSVSEIKVVIPLQNAVNKLVVDMLVASEMGAMPARWVAGWELPEDPETKQPIPPKITDYLNRFFVMSDPSAKAGGFPQVALETFVQAIEMLVQHIAAQTRTPRHYLIQHGQAPSGDSIKGSETGLVRKVKKKQFHLGEGWEESVRLAFLVLGDPRANAVNAETIWRDAETRSASEHVDGVMKKATIGVPPQQLFEDLDYTPEQIRRFPKMWAEWQLMQAMNGLDITDTPEPAVDDAA